MYRIIKSIFYSLTKLIIITSIFACTTNENEAISKEIYPCDRDHIIFDRPVWSVDLVHSRNNPREMIDNEDYVFIKGYLSYFIIDKKNGEARELRPPIFTFNQVTINEKTIFFAKNNTNFNSSDPPLHGFIAYDFLTLQPKELKPDYFLNLGVIGIGDSFIFDNEYYMSCFMVGGKGCILKYDEDAHEFTIVHCRSTGKGHAKALYKKSDGKPYVLYLYYDNREGTNAVFYSYALENGEELDYEFEITNIPKNSFFPLHYVSLTNWLYINNSGIGIINHKSLLNDEYISTFFDYETGKILYTEDGPAYPLNENFSLVTHRDTESQFNDIYRTHAIFNHFSRERINNIDIRSISELRRGGLYKDRYFIGDHGSHKILDIETGCFVGSVTYDYSGNVYLFKNKKGFLTIGYGPIFHMFNIDF